MTNQQKLMLRKWEHALDRWREALEQADQCERECDDARREFYALSTRDPFVPETEAMHGRIRAGALGGKS